MSLAQNCFLHSKTPLGFQNQKGLVHKAAQITDEPYFLHLLYTNYIANNPMNWSKDKFYGNK